MLSYRLYKRLIKSFIMKNIFKLSLNEAVSFFIDRDEKIIQKYVGISKFDQEYNISITCPTQRVGPDYKQDILQLKNLILETEKKLSPLLSKKDLTLVMDRIRKVEQDIDYSHNKDGLIIYANTSFAAVVKVSLELSPEVIIGNFFDSRPLYKAIQNKQKYYIVTVSQQKIRLLFVSDNELVDEVTDGNFPFENTEYYTTDIKKLAQDTFEENLLKEFFNVADKRLQIYFSEDNILPVILAGDLKSVAYFKQMMDNSDMVINSINGNFDDTPTHEFIDLVYPRIVEYVKSSQNKYNERIESARSSGLAVYDFSDIYRNASSGNIDTLYIKDGFSLKGRIDNGNLIIDNHAESRDLTLDIISKAQENNGKIYFIGGSLVSDMVLVKRY